MGGFLPVHGAPGESAPPMTQIVVNEGGYIKPKMVPVSPAMDLYMPQDVVRATGNGNSNSGRNGKQEKLKEIANDPKASKSDKGWIKQDMNEIAKGKRDNIRNPPGKVLAHERGREAGKGYSYKHSNLQTKELHKIQHKFDNNGKRNRERPLEQ